MPVSKLAIENFLEQIKYHITDGNIKAAKK